MRQKKRLDVIECSGTDYEIGVQYGEAARENVTRSIDALMGRVKNFHGASKEEVLSNTRKYLPVVEEFDPKLVETLKGQAEGARVVFDEILLFIGTDPYDIECLGAEVEVILGDERESYIIDKTSGVYIPEGLKHILIYRNFEKPHFLVGFSMRGEYR